ncbi:hypothetical protein Glove_364g21 [Diversispora epigaea]|uniref:Uncharacterized protein n=1 Tax=Diversispora epigaea TaxID=1348612 RepID=A0A397HCS1_9GLOM|nr:hypothetical protein Glove_364g21 [Diversispora epigaea]
MFFFKKKSKDYSFQMPAKLHTICYVHNCNERNTAEFIIKEVTRVARLSDVNPSNIIYLQIKIFIPLNQYPLQNSFLLH